MSSVLDFIYTIPIYNQWLIYAPLHHVSAMVNEAAVVAFKKGDLSLADFGFNEDSGSVHIPRPPKGLLMPEFLGIIPTRGCNMNCVYCDFDASNEKMAVMDLSMAVSAVDCMTDIIADSGMDRLEVHFFGGEPFCAPDVVDVVVHRARARAIDLGVPAIIEADTNGYFDESRCQFIGDYIDRVVLSFDGPEAIHNKHRPTLKGKGTFQTIARNALSLGKSLTKLCLRICVTQESVNNLNQITRWFCQTFRPEVIDFETLKPTPRSDEFGLQPPDPFEFSIKYIESHFTALNFGVKPIYAAADIDKLQHSFCPVGRDTLIVSPGGRISACYLQEDVWKSKNLDLNLGHLDTEGQMSIDGKAVDRVRNITVSNKVRCNKCLARWHCAGGCHVTNWLANATDVYDNVCIQARLITICLLLNELGYYQEAIKLLHDRPSLEKLAFMKSDLLSDWGSYD